MTKYLYTVYQITNLLTSQIYIGVHRTTNLNDGYMGSGSLIKKAIKEYGKENFSKKYLHIFDNPDAMHEAETKLVDETFVLSENTYNIRTGGLGRFEESFVNYSKLWKNESKPHTEISKAKIAKASKEYFEKMSNEDFEAWKLKIGQSLIGRAPTTGFKGKKHSKETLEKLSEMRTQCNSSLGTKWIHHKSTLEVMKISSDEAHALVECGEYEYGRKPSSLIKGNALEKRRARRKKNWKELPDGCIRVGDTGLVGKVTDDQIIEALRLHGKITPALRSLGIATQGKNYYRAKALMCYI